MKSFFLIRLLFFFILYVENIFLRVINFINDICVSWLKEVIFDNSNRKGLFIFKEIEGCYFLYFMYDILVFLV